MRFPVSACNSDPPIKNHLKSRLQSSRGGEPTESAMMVPQAGPGIALKAGTPNLLSKMVVRELEVKRQVQQARARAHLSEAGLVRRLPRQLV
jgi:hypothetical protein